MDDSSNKTHPKPKGILRYSTMPPKDPEFEMFSMPKVSNSSRGIVIAIEETKPSKFVLSAPPKAYLSRAKLSESVTTPSDSTAVERLCEGEEQIPTIPSSRSLTPPSLCRAVSPIGKNIMTPTRISSPTLVRSNSAPSTGIHSPVSPVMRSIFPRYNPNLPLAKQHYYPSTPSNGGATEAPRSSAYSESVCSQAETLGAKILKTVPGNRFSPEASGHHETAPKPSLSTPEELLDLWSIANGQGSQEAKDIYTLGLRCPKLCPSEEIIFFTSSTCQVLYRLEADGDDIEITRSHPINSTTTIHISAPTISALTPNNPLITTIFPNLAELMALDQSSTIAVDHRLGRQASVELQAEALHRAYQQEASSLFWDTDSEKYYLRHPTLMGLDTPATFPIESTQEGIKIFLPNEPSKTPTPVLILSFDSLSITIHACLLSRLPSLYLLDTLLATLLTILLHLHRTSPSPSPLAISTPSPSPSYPPPPSLHSISSQRNQHPEAPKKTNSWAFLSFLGIARNSKSLSRVKTEVEDEESTPARSLRLPTSSALPITATINQSKGEKFKLPSPPPPETTFELIDPPDEKLPRTTRAVLKLLYWAFSVTVWALGVGFRVLAAMVIGLGKCLMRL